MINLVALLHPFTRIDRSREVYVDVDVEKSSTFHSFVWNHQYLTLHSIVSIDGAIVRGEHKHAYTGIGREFSKCNMINLVALLHLFTRIDIENIEKFMCMSTCTSHRLFISLCVTSCTLHCIGLLRSVSHILRLEHKHAYTNTHSYC